MAFFPKAHKQTDYQSTDHRLARMQDTVFTGLSSTNTSTKEVYVYWLWIEY